MLQKCNGGCGRTIGSGCGCCSPDFPQEYGYCENCFSKSQAYNNETQALNNLIDHLNDGGLLALKLFLDLYDHNFENIYKEIVDRKLKE